MTIDPLAAPLSIAARPELTGGRHKAVPAGPTTPDRSTPASEEGTS